MVLDIMLDLALEMVLDIMLDLALEMASDMDFEEQEHL
jgi:hypothetical protein